MTKIDKTDIDNIKVILNEAKIDNVSKFRIKKGDYEIDASGHYIMPGFVDLHAHAGSPQKAPVTDYVYKLWLAHGVTTVRGVGLGSLEFSLSEKKRSKINEISANKSV